MTAITTRRKPASADAGELAEQLAEARAEIDKLRDQLRAVARLAIGVGVTATPASTMSGPPRTVTHVCRVHGVGENHAALIDTLFP